MGNGNRLSALYYGCITARCFPGSGTQSILPQGTHFAQLCCTEYFVDIYFFCRACSGWSRIIQLLFYASPSFFFARCPLSENCSSTLTIRGKVQSDFHYIQAHAMLLLHLSSRRAVRMGQHVWLLLATIVTELLVITKWSQGQFPNPLPSEVKWGWTIGATLLVLYPTIQVRSFRYFQHPHFPRFSPLFWRFLYPA